MKSKMKNQLPALLVFLFFLFACTAQNGPPNVLGSPKSVSIDQTNSRLFVVDSQNNSLSLINLTNNTIVTGQPLLNQNSAIQLPQLPQDIAVLNLGSGVTRIFIIGNGPVPRNQITVLDYDSTNGLRTVSFSPMIVGANTAADQSDILGGLAIDPTTSTVFVSNSSDGIVRAYDVSAGTEKAGSPLTVNPTPQGMGINTTVHRLFVSSFGGNSISVINTQDLTIPAVSFDATSKSSDLASSTNANGTVLFLIDPNTNEILIFNFNVTTPNTSTLIGTAITPPAAGQPVTTSTILTGAVAQVAAANLSDSRVVGTITQSTGDLAVVDVSADLSSYSATRVSVLSGLGAYGIDILTDSSGNGTLAYFASVSAGALSIVNITVNQYAGQIL